MSNPVREGSRVTETYPGDWLLNSFTGLVFDSTIVGANGQTGLKLGRSSEMKPGDVAVSVSQGSSVAAGTVVYGSASVSLADSGLAEATAGINVVGTGGYNSGLRQVGTSVTGTQVGR